MTRNRHLLFAFVLVSLIVLSFNPVNASGDYNVQSRVNAFLVDVAGFDENDLTYSSFSFSTRNIGSNNSQLSINAKITSNNKNFTLAMTIVNEKVVFYTLNSFDYPSFGATTTNKEKSLNTAESFLNDYKTFYAITYIDEFTDALSILSTQDSVVQYENASLKVEYANASDFGTKYASYSWIKKIGEIEVPNLSVSVTVDKTGRVTKFYNNLEHYKIVVADDLISEEQAMAIGQPYIDEYVEENDVKVAEVEAKFRYSRDVGSSRGDSYTIYPQWAISANFAETSKEGVYGYIVMIWADTGEVYHSGTQGFYTPLTSGFPSSSMLLLISGITCTFTLTVIAIYMFRKKRLAGHKMEETL